MNLLTDILPTEIIVDEVSYPIHTDFRNWMQFDHVSYSPDLSQQQRVVRMLELCYKEKLPPNLQIALEAAYHFFAAGIERPKKATGQAKTQGRIYDYVYDADYIYSAFYSQYGIDLTKADLHWYQFQALFKSLGEDTLFVKMMEYRGMDLSKIKDKEQRSYYRKMKKLYELPRSRTEEEKMNQIEEALLNDGDVSHIL